MLRALAWFPQFLLLGLIAYNTAVSLWGWRAPPAAPAGSRRRRFRVVIPAHDEAPVIASLLQDLTDQEYREDLIRIVVIADRCTDDTAARARPFAEVHERASGPAGKGPALAEYLSRDPLADDEAVVVLDADNRVPRDLLQRFADELDTGHEVLQAYLDVVDPGRNVIANASALTYWAGNRMVQLARRNLGWSCDLGGTGMCFTGRALRAAGGFGSSVTEDQELLVRLVLTGVQVVWLHDLRIHDEKPTALSVAVRQRSRWMAGKREVSRSSSSRLLRHARRTRSWEPVDVAVRLAQPGRSFVALLSGLIAVAAGIIGGTYLLPWILWAAVAAFQVLLPVAFLWRDEVGASYLLRYPLVALIAAIWVPVRIVSGRADTWYHTPHGPG